MPKLIEANGDQIPLEACRFDASVEIGAGDGPVVPIKINARSNQPVEHYWWGTLVHDMAGMLTDKPTIPIDYCHDPGEVLGVGEKFTTDEAAGLDIEGNLVIFEEKDRASEVLFKSRNKVPYQGSIFFDPYRLVLEQVGEGMTAAVNGYQLSGPALIARKWVLRGVAVCPYGVDANTNVMLSAHNRGGHQAGALPPASYKDSTMSTAATQEKPPQDKTAEQLAAEAAAKAKTEAEEKAQAEAAAAAAKSDDTDEDGGKNDPAPATAGQQSAAPGKRFLDAFGEPGGVWFAQGLSFEEAQAKFNAATVERIKATEAENAKLKGSLAALRGEAPLSDGNGEVTPEQRRAAELAANGVTDNYAKLAGSIKMPGKKK